MLQSTNGNHAILIKVSSLKLSQISVIAIKIFIIMKYLCRFIQCTDVKILCNNENNEMTLMNLEFTVKITIYY